MIAFIAAACVALALRFGAGTWAHPVSLFAGAWAAFLAIPAFFIPEADPYPSASLTILGIIVGVSMALPMRVTQHEIRPRKVVVGWLARAVVLFGSAAAIGAAILTQRVNGISLGSVFSWDAVSLAARQLTTLRYDGSMTAPLLATLLLAFAYAAAVVAPYVAATHRGMIRLFYLIGPGLGSALYAALTTARAPFLITVALTASAWLTVRAIQTGGRPRLPAKVMLGVVIGVGAVFAVFVAVAASRAGRLDLEALRRTAAVYAGGSIPAFDEWLPTVESPQFGAQTFAGVAQFIVGDSSIGSAYSTFVDIGQGVTTNVFTAFRPLAEDFTVPGVLVAMVLGAFIASYAYRRAIMFGSTHAAMTATVWGAYIFFAQTTSIFSFSNVCFGLVVAWLTVVASVRMISTDSLVEERALDTQDGATTTLV